MVAGGGSWGGVCAGASVTERQRRDTRGQKNLIPPILHSFRAGAHLVGTLFGVDPPKTSGARRFPAATPAARENFPA